MIVGIKTEDFVKNMPPKKITAGVNWLKILDDFNPSIVPNRLRGGYPLNHNS